jgi:putative ABC transport system permease protein
MLLSDLIKLSLEALKAHKLRTFLTVLGIVIGVTSVIAIVSIVDGMNIKVTSLINQMGSSTFVVSKMGADDFSSAEAFREANRRKDIRFRDLKALREDCEYCQEVGGRVVTFQQVKFQSKKTRNVPIAGATANFVRITDFEIGEGRGHNRFEEDRYVQVTILGSSVAEELFKNLDPIGKTVRIGSHKYEVIGIAKPRGSILGEDLDNFAIIPLTTLLKNYGTHRSIDIFVKAASEASVSQAVDETRAIMRARRHVSFAEEDNFAITTSEDWLEFYNQMTGTIQVVAIGIPAIALVVAGIVVMNIMMVSVTERTREIGIRKSLGAMNRHILLQFLTETLMMSFGGGALGIALGIIAAKFLSEQGDLPFVISDMAILGGVFISTGIGLFFGLYPAYKGAQLDPVDAMRFE